MEAKTFQFAVLLNSNRNFDRDIAPARANSRVSFAEFRPTFSRVPTGLTTTQYLIVSSSCPSLVNNMALKSLPSGKNVCVLRIGSLGQQLTFSNSQVRPFNLFPPYGFSTSWMIIPSLISFQDGGSYGRRCWFDYRIHFWII